MNKARPIPSTALPRDQSCQRSHRTNLAHACESADLAYFTAGRDALQLYTDAAPVLYASRRVAVTAQSGVLEVHVHGVVERILCARTVGAHVLCLARKLILRVSRRDL